VLNEHPATPRYLLNSLILDIPLISSTFSCFSENIRSFKIKYSPWQPISKTKIYYFGRGLCCKGYSLAKSSRSLRFPVNSLSSVRRIFKCKKTTGKWYTFGVTHHSLDSLFRFIKICQMWMPNLPGRRSQASPLDHLNPVGFDCHIDCRFCTHFAT
jgi:hypothetical protein